jgi:hypothetical protein
MRPAPLVPAAQVAKGRPIPRLRDGQQQMPLRSFALSKSKRIASSHLERPSHHNLLALPPAWANVSWELVRESAMMQNRSLSLLLRCQDDGGNCHLHVGMGLHHSESSLCCSRDGVLRSWNCHGRASGKDDLNCLRAVFAP